MNILDTISDNIFAQGTSTGFHISVAIFILLTIRAMVSLNKTSELYKFFTHPKTIGQLCVILVWCYLIYRFVKTHPKDKKHSAKLQEATKKAILALLIAFFARVDLVIAPFWLVWLLAYYLEDWV